MRVDRSYVAQNEAARARLRALVGEASDEALSRAVSGGWTVAGVLGHLAFWDQRALVLLEQWEANPLRVPNAIDEADVDWINDAAKILILALPPRRAADLALAVAEAVDRRAAALADDLVSRNATAGHPVSLLRAKHRHDHLDELERAVRA